MDPHVIHPLDRMKPQRGRRLDLPVPVMVVPAVRRCRGRWCLKALAMVASIVAAAVCAIAVQAF